MTSQSTTLFDRAGELTASLEVLGQQIHGSSLAQAIKRVVVECVHVAALGKTRSVEQYPRSLGLPASVHEAPEILDVKSTNSRSICSFAKFSLVSPGKREYADLLRDFDINTSRSPSWHLSAGYQRRLPCPRFCATKTKTKRKGSPVHDWIPHADVQIRPKLDVSCIHVTLYYAAGFTALNPHPRIHFRNSRGPESIDARHLLV